LCIRQDNIDLSNKTIISRKIKKRKKKTKILTQLKKDVAIRNLKNQIVVKFDQITATNKNKCAIVVDKNNKRSINTIIVNKDNTKSKSSYLSILQTEIRNCKTF